MRGYSNWAVIATALLAVAACSSPNTSGIKILSGSGPTAASANATPGPQPIRVLSAEEIRSTLIGKTWQYTGADSNGFITYNPDGSLTYQDDVKGEGRGTWSAVEGQLCQSMGGRPTECSEFKSTGDAYHAGKLRLVGA